MKEFEDENQAAAPPFLEGLGPAAGGPQPTEEAAASVHVAYQLKTDEVYEVLKRSYFYKKALRKAKIETAVLGLMTVLFGITWIVNNDVNAMIFTIVCAGLIGLVWATPYFSLRSQAIKWASQPEIDLDIGPHGIHVGYGESRWEIPLDGSVVCEKYESMWVLHTAESELVILPTRAMQPHQLGEVEARLLAGTRVRNRP